MQSTDNGAITEGGIWGGYAAAMGGAVRAIQNPNMGRRQFITTVLTAGFFGVIVGFLTMWYYSDRVPPHIAACAGAGVGLGVSEIMKLVMKLLSKAGDRLIDGVDAKIEAAGWKAPSKAEVKSDLKPAPAPPTSGVFNVPPPDQPGRGV